ncbi:PREDICTED: RAD51-associated protein 2 [Condylura cristata]|uniref:RAD51-associated protein 2 n=1 Tax=Condylura cristata TaxID=143302 RepID=UPI000643A273|nr:PREDICTED: RAD51-associated protein 2 [Condylura cristata]
MYDLKIKYIIEPRDHYGSNLNPTNAWELPPRPFKALLYSPHANFEAATHACVEKSAVGQSCNPGSQESEFQGARSRSLSSQSSDSGGGASSRAEREVLSSRCGQRPRAEAGPRPPGAASHDPCGAGLGDGSQGSVSGRERQRDPGYEKRAERLLSEVTVCQEKQPAFHEMENRRKADRVTLSETTEKSTSASMLKIATAPNQPSVETAKPRCFGESRLVSIPGLPTGGNSRASSACLKEVAEEKDTREASGRGFTNMDWSQNRLDVQKQKLRGDKKMVGAESIFPDESYLQSCCPQNVCTKKLDAITLNAHPGRIKSDTRGPEKDFTVIPGNANVEEAGTCLNSYMPNTKLEKSQSWAGNTAQVSRENCWFVDSYKMECENVGKTGAELSLLQLLEINLLSDTIARNAREEQLKSLMTRALGRQKALTQFFWLHARGETDNMLQLRYCAPKKDFHLSIFEKFTEGIFYFRKCVSGSEKDTLNWYEILIYKDQTDSQKVTRSVDVNRKESILSMYSQSKLSEPRSTPTANIVSLFSNLDSLARKSVSKLQEEYIFKWIVSYPKNTVECHNTLKMFSRLLEDNMEPILEKYQVKDEQVFEEPREKSMDFVSMTTKNTQFPIFETYEKISVDFDNLDDILPTKEISSKNKCCPEQLMNEGNLTVKTLAKSGSPFIQTNHGYISADLYEMSKHNQDLDTERKPEHNMLSSFNFNDILADSINIRQQTIQSSHYRRPSEQTIPASITQMLNLGNLLTETEGKSHILMLKEEVKTTAQSLKNICYAHEDIKIDKEEKNSFDSKADMSSVQPVLLMNKKANVEETKNVSQNNVADRNEYESILQEIKLANSEHFHPKNDSTESFNHQLETDLSVTNNECFQDSTAKCLPTETLTMAKDFEMKSKFDLVLEELRMFHEISKENEILSTVEVDNGLENYFEKNNVGEMNMEIKKDLKVSTGNKICTSSLCCDTDTGPNMHKRHQNVFKWKTVPKSGEQEVPKQYCSSGKQEQELFYSEKDCEKPSSMRPAFFSDELHEEKLNYLLRGVMDPVSKCMKVDDLPEGC